MSVVHRKNSFLINKHKHEQLCASVKLSEFKNKEEKLERKSSTETC